MYCLTENVCFGIWVFSTYNMHVIIKKMYKYLYKISVNPAFILLALISLKLDSISVSQISDKYLQITYSHRSEKLIRLLNS